jgi:cellulose synthase/poly-beta-1,6-N-acetylglucosamine synthase-like glycosyltransferase
MENTEGHRWPLRSEAASAVATIAAVMPAYNCQAFVNRSLSPLLDMRRRGELSDIIVIDDGSTDGTAQAVVALGARVVSAGGHRGQSAARNLGVQEAKADVLWFVDADVVAHSGAIRHIRHALADPQVAAVFGSYDDSPTAPNFLSQYKNLVHHYYHQSSLRDVSSFWTGCGAVWKDAFLAVGGFDSTRPAIEDIEFGYRLRAAGGRIRVAPELQGTHLKVWRFTNLLTTEVRDRAIPWAFLILSRGHAGNELNVALTERLRALITCLCTLSIVTSLSGLTSWWAPPLLLAFAFAANLELLALFQRRKGWLFAIGGLLFHQFYYLYSTAAYCWCWVVVKSRKLLRCPG